MNNIISEDQPSPPCQGFSPIFIVPCFVIVVDQQYLTTVLQTHTSYERVGLLLKVGYFVLYFNSRVCCHARKTRNTFDIKVLLEKGQALQEDQHKWILRGCVLSWHGFVKTKREARQEWMFETYLYWQPPSKVVALEVVFEVRLFFLDLRDQQQVFPHLVNILFCFWQQFFVNRQVC